MSTDRDALLQALAQDPSGLSIGFAERGLPPGRVVDVPGAGPLYWVSEGAPSAEEVASVRARAAVSGMWPLLVEGGGTWMVYGHGDQEQPAYWLGEGRPLDASRIDPDRWLAEQWQDLIADNESDFEPDDRVSALAPAGTTWPGLAPDSPRPALDADLCADATTAFLLRDDWLDEPRMVLVPARSGSGALIAARCTLAEIDDLSGHAAVLRSWERRFAARVIAMRRDTLFVAVASPPTRRSTAVHVACEHFAFAPDNVEQNADSFSEYVDGLVGKKLWQFWWD